MPDGKKNIFFQVLNDFVRNRVVVQIKGNFQRIGFNDIYAIQEGPKFFLFRTIQLVVR